MEFDEQFALEYPDIDKYNCGEFMKCAAKKMWNASRKQAIDECIKAAESLSDKFYEDDQYKRSEKRKDRSQGAASVMHKLKEMTKG